MNDKNYIFEISFLEIKLSTVIVSCYLFNVAIGKMFSSKKDTKKTAERGRTSVLRAQ